LNEYDIIVIGAGPAGSGAAKTAATLGAKTLILEEHTEIGIPAHCCGLVHFPVSERTQEIIRSVNRRAVLQEYRARRIYAPSGKIVKTITIPERTKFLVDRALFDKELARQAIEAGADLLLNTRATGLIQEGDRYVGIKTGSTANPEIYGKVIIAADGITAMQKGVPQWLGFTPADQKYFGGISMDMARVKDIEPDTMEEHYGAFIDAGKTSIGPRDESSCSIYVTKLKDLQNIKLGNYTLSKKLKDAVPIRMTGFRHSWDLGKRLPELVKNNLILTGSSGSWRGIVTSYVTGTCAGQAAAEAVLENDITEKRLNKYEDLLSEAIPQKGYQFKEKVNPYFYQRSDSEIEHRLLDMEEKGMLTYD
jgi:digeranylgeranylglycerophospholipid reductase